MARPDNTKNSSVLPPTLFKPDCEPVRKTISQENASTITVRMAVATVESVRRTPHFARMAVSPAKRAEPNAKNIHIKKSPSFSNLHKRGPAALSAAESIIAQNSRFCNKVQKFFQSADFTLTLANKLVKYYLGTAADMKSRDIEALMAA